jgi:peroxiredoxin
MVTRNSLILIVGLAVALVAGCTPEATRGQGVAASPTGITPVLIGTQIPSMTLFTPEGKRVNLGTTLASRPTVLVIYRGNWCVYCQKQLAEMQRIEPQLLAMGYQIIAISPDTPADLRKGEIGQNVKYQLLSDEQMSASTALGLAYYVDDETRMRLESFGVTLKNVSAQPNWMLPVPAVFIVGTDSRVRWEYVNPDYKEPVPTDLLLAAAKAFASK